MSGLLIFEVAFDLDGNSVLYKKEFAEVIYDDVRIDFVPATGKIVAGYENLFYFVAWKGEKKIFKTQIQSAQIFKSYRNNNQLVA